MKCSFLNLYVNNMAAFDRIRLLRLKKILTLYSVNIEADKICQAKKEKEMLGSQNLFRSSRERRVSITGKRYAAICQRLLFPLLQNVSSSI